jgi:hypothetical protein
MADIKGPAIDPETFRVEGHCCGIRIPSLQAMNDGGLEWELTPETKARLVAEGVLPDDEQRHAPKAK